MANQTYLVRVRDNYPWDSAQIGGQRFYKHVPLERAASEVSDEMRSSPILEITETTPASDPVVDAAVAPVLNELPDAPAPETEPNAEEATQRAAKRNRKAA